jgi:hypothetical protein
MADTKISALPASTTPLAGTELVPIVQSGTTKQVSVANLTAGRNVGAADLTTTGNTILGNASTDTLNVGNGDIVKDASGNTGFGTGAVAIATKVQIQGTASSNGFLRFGRYDGYSGGIEWRSYSGTGGFDIKTSTATVADLVFSRTEGTGNYIFNDANLVIGTSGKGIDFSATPGTGTSELLADYEEGTWTPAFGAFAGAFTSLTYSVQSGKYTKVGNQVTAEFSIVVTAVTTGTAATLLLVTGLPFTPVSGVCVTTYQSNFLTQGPDFGQFYGAGSNMLLRFKSLNSSVNVDPTQVTNATELQGLVTYFV